MALSLIVSNRFVYVVIRSGIQSDEFQIKNKMGLSNVAFHKFKRQESQIINHKSRFECVRNN